MHSVCKAMRKQKLHENIYILTHVYNIYIYSHIYLYICLYMYVLYLRGKLGKHEQVLK